jgi:hypothetical protein
MAFRFFTVPIQNAEQAEAELNGFLRSHKVLSIDRRWVEQGPAQSMKRHGHLWGNVISFEALLHAALAHRHTFVVLPCAYLS